MQQRVYGHITANNVNLRADGNFVSLGQVNKNDRYEVIPTCILTFQGYDYMKVEMLSGQNAGKIGWVAIIYTTGY